MTVYVWFDLTCITRYSTSTPTKHCDRHHSSCVQCTLHDPSALMTTRLFWLAVTGVMRGTLDTAGVVAVTVLSWGTCWGNCWV